ncbi:MAG: alanine racemase [Tuberibacillus sp.]
MSVSFYRDTWVEVNLDAIEQNVKNMRSYIPKDTQIMAVVKADGYGHGAVQTAKTALEAGATWLATALLDEAVALRMAGINAPILVLGYTRPKDVSIAVQHHISLTVYQKEWIQEVSENYKEKAPVFLHLKIDTGMGRIGVKTKEELQDLVTALQADPRIIAEGVFTHFATADENDPTYYQEQYHRFTDMLKHLKALNINPNVIHCGNSAASLKYPDKMFNMIRFGIAMYGLSPSKEMKAVLPFQLNAAFSLYSNLIHVKEISAGETVGYGATFKAEEPTWVGTVPIGYADGWLRGLSGKAFVLIKDKPFPIIGRICMDQFMCQLDGPYSLGEKVTLIGKDGNRQISCDDIAEHLNTINYEVTCMISKRVPRLYLKNGKIIHTSNPVLA